VESVVTFATHRFFVLVFGFVFAAGM